MGQVETLNWQWPLGPAPGRDHGRVRRTDRHRLGSAVHVRVVWRRGVDGAAQFGQGHGI